MRNHDRIPPYRIGISCIGSGVGQSCVSSLRRSALPFTTIGLGTNPFAYGLYECDTHDYTLSIYDQGYLDNLFERCEAHAIDLVLPGHDDEVLLYAENADRFRDAGLLAVHPGLELVQLCRDKQRMSREIREVSDLFVRSFALAEVEEALRSGELEYPFIAKPRGGFASRGIEIIRSFQDLGRITEAHVVQELAIPAPTDPAYSYYMKQLAEGRNPQVAEYSVQLVFGFGGELMGRMCTYNKLSQGIPIEIVPLENQAVWDAVDRVIPALRSTGLRGPLNLQGRMTASGLKLFEMNPRFTGITGLRSIMGFNEVEACVKEWLGLDRGSNRLTYNHDRFGIRQTTDKAISFSRNLEVTQLRKRVDPSSGSSIRRIVLTGATGYLGQLLAARIIEHPESLELITLNRDANRAVQILGGESVSHFSYDDLRRGQFHLGEADVLLHAGFARPHHSRAEVGESLDQTEWLFALAAKSEIPEILNISSQSVYGTNRLPPWTEETPPAPETAYGQAKYATELILRTLGGVYPHILHKSIRLCTLEGWSSGFEPISFISKMTQQALSGEPLVITDSQRMMERLDVRDAAEAIVCMLLREPKAPHSVFNVGSGERHTVADIANMIAATAADLTGNPRVKVQLLDNGQPGGSFGMRSDRFYTNYGWHPTHTLRDTIRSMVRQLSLGHGAVT